MTANPKSMDFMTIMAMPSEFGIAPVHTDEIVCTLGECG
jgi:hypothetical protein